MIGRTISHYKILEKLGEGGMGEVFLAQDTKLNRTVALKFLPSQYALDEEFRARFKREAQAAAALNHPNIVTIHEVGEHDSRPYIAMEYVEGPSLKDRVGEKELSMDEALDLAIQIGEGLAAAHRAGILHRDIKPQNVLIGKDGRVRILDFGLAKLKTDSMITDTGSTVGTVAYMSPEQAQKTDIDQRSDVFSFGIVLYEMITGQLPFRGEHPAAMMYSIVNETPEPLARYKAGVSEDLQRIADKALRKDPETRYQSAADMVADLKELRMDSGTRRTRPLKRPYWAGGRRRSSAGLIAGIVVIVALLIVGGQFLLERFRAPAPESPEEEPASGAPWRNSIAVLPFRDFSPNKDQEFFCHGMTDAIINKLAGLEDLKIISLSSAMRYKDADKDIKEIGRDLGVSTILEGNIQKEENRIRLSAQLINVADDAHLWSQTYDRELESVFAIQDEISEAIVEVLKIRLLGDEKNSFVKRFTDNLEAYNAYAQGRYLWNKRTEQHLVKSVEYFERAVELDPGYALAYAGLADAWGVLPSNTSYPVKEAVPKAKEAARKALELDDGLAEGYASLGLALMAEGNNQSAEPEFLRAIELNPGYAYAHYWYSMALDEMGRHEEALKELETAYELDPLSVVIVTNLLGKRAQSGNSEEAAGLFERAIEIEPSRRATYKAYADALLKLGKPERALEMFRRAMEADSSYVHGYNEIAYLHGYMGDYDKAIEAANKYVELLPDKPSPFDTLGDIYAMGGDLDQAIASYKRALEIDPELDASRAKLANSYVWKRDYRDAEKQYRELASSDNVEYAAGALAGQWLVQFYQGKFEKTLELIDEEIPDAKDEILVYNMLNKSLFRFLIHAEREAFDLALAEIGVMRGMLDEVKSKDRTRMRDAEAAILALQGEIAAADDVLRSWRNDLDMNVPNQASEYWRALGIVELVKGDAQTAVTYLRRGLYEGSKPLFEARYFLGQAYLEAGQYDKAAEVLERAARRYDDRRMRFPAWSVKTHYYLGIAYEESGRTEEAIEQYEEFLNIWRDADPGILEVEDAKERLARLKEGA